MTGYQSKKAAALDEDGMYLVHHTEQQDATMQSLKDLKRSVCDELGKAAFAQPAQERTWVSLTDDQIKEIVGPWGDTPIKGYTRKLIDQIDAKLKEMNT
jgi:hypothetical protein